ncbi:MAG: SgcJ/EcaC family oxidoreductase [Planctomycetes bacterium]|nr:SgcJ/EcaC family oxidoreductase [Planctomycetota bacterium]
MTRDERAIRNAIALWLSATKAGDMPTVLSLLADDVVFITPGQPPFGKKAFAGDGQKPYRFHGSARVREVVVSGDWAHTRCDVKVSITPARGAKAMRLAGPTLSIWRREKRGWVISRDANFVQPQE